MYKFSIILAVLTFVTTLASIDGASETTAGDIRTAVRETAQETGVAIKQVSTTIKHDAKAGMHETKQAIKQTGRTAFQSAKQVGSEIKQGIKRNKQELKEVFK